jgi:hypothetical protein
MKSEESEVTTLLSKMTLSSVPHKPIGGSQKIVSPVKRLLLSGKKLIIKPVEEVKAVVVTEVATEVKAEVATEAKTEVATEAKTEVATEVKAEVVTEVKAEVKAEDIKPSEEVKPAITSILSFQHWKNTKAFKAIQAKETQIKYYQRMKAADEVLQLVALDSKPFGSECEKILTEIFGLGPRTSTQNDGTFNGKKIEIKTARYWAGQDNCVWQHLEPDHDYEYALFVLLDFQGWKVWGIKKSLLMGDLRDKKVVTFQGKQGWWTRKTAILEYLTPITSVLDLQGFLV